MNDEMIALARRAVACKGWRWMSGMRTTDALRVIHDEALFPGRPCVIREGGWVEPRPLQDALPDLTDPATLGCLLALVREAWGMPTGITVGYSSDEALWGVSWSGATHGGWCGRGKTEAEALVVALEGAP